MREIETRGWFSRTASWNTIMHDHVQLVVTFVPSFLLFRLTTNVFTRPFYEPRTKAKGKKKKKKKRGRKRWSSNGTRGRLLLVAVSEFRILARVLYFECAYLSIFRTLFLLSSSPPLQTVLCICKSRPRTLMDISLRNEHAKLYFNSCDIFAWNVILRSLRNILA